MSRSASLFGFLGLLFLAFGVAALALVGPSDWFVLLNLTAGIGLLIAYLAFGFEGFKGALGQRSTRYGAGAALYSLLFVLLVIGLNVVSARHHKRVDVTEAGVYTLAPQSRKVVDALKEPLAISAFVEGGVSPQLETLLDSFRYANPARVSFNIYDPDKEPARVDQLKITSVPSVQLQYGKESFIVTQPSEETITNAIIRVAGGKKKIVYFTEGDGEAPIDAKDDPKGYSQAKQALEQENYEVKTLLLPSVEQVPDDASVVIVAGFDRPPSDHAVDVLDAYLKRGGNVLMLMGPRQGSPKLTSMLEQWGVKLGNDIVIDQEVRLLEGPRLGVMPMTKTYGAHPITQNFRDYIVFPQTRTVEAAEGKKGVQPTVLVKTSPTSWAETKVDELFTKQTANLDPDDRKGPLGVAVAVAAKLKEMGVEGATADDARLVVIGTPMFADNDQMVQSRLNGDLFLNAVSWLVGQTELVSIRSRTVRASRALMTEGQQLRVFYLSILILPELLIALGIAVWWRRRSA